MAGGDYRGIGTAGDQLRARIALELRQAAGVIEMRMTVKRIFHVRKPKAQGGDVLFDLRRALRQPAIQKNRAGRRHDRKRTDAFRTGIIKVAGDAEWRGGTVPGRAL